MRSQAAAVMSVSVNGNFAAPNGVAFDSIEAPYLTPAFSASSGQYRVNFGERPFARAHRWAVHVRPCISQAEAATVVPLV